MKAKNARERLLSEPESYLSTVGGFLRAKRLEFGLTQKEVAKRAGITQPTLSNIETGRHLPQRSTLDRLKEALGNCDIPSDFILQSLSANNKGVPRFTKKHTNTLGKYLTKRRIELYLTQKEVAARADISQGALSNIEIGRYFPKPLTLDRLKEALGNFDIPSGLILRLPFVDNKGVPWFTKKRTNALGRFVTKRRIELDLTQEHLAKRLKVCRVVITRIETGTYNYGKRFLEKLATALECEFPPGLFLL